MGEERPIFQSDVRKRVSIFNTKTGGIIIIHDSKPYLL